MTTDKKDSVRALLSELKEGEQDAAQQLWERYCLRLVEVARQKLGRASRRVADEEDIALLAFYSLCEGVREKRFPRLEDRDDLWKILLVITERKAIDHIRAGKRQKRGGGEVRGESVFGRLDWEGVARGIERVMDSEPTPAYAALAVEECGELLEVLDSEQLRKIALWKLEGWNNADIAEKLGCTTKTVGRKLQKIREIWNSKSDTELEMRRQ